MIASSNSLSLSLSSSLPMRWLIHGVQLGGSLLFHFSDHGSRKVDNDDGNIERDGFDETLCSLDYESNDMILDDEINEILVRPIPHCAKLYAVIDACHSDTILDLPYLCRINRVQVGACLGSLNLEFVKAVMAYQKKINTSTNQ